MIVSPVTYAAQRAQGLWRSAAPAAGSRGHAQPAVAAMNLALRSSVKACGTNR
jgi:hypothetical protein